MAAASSWRPPGRHHLNPPMENLREEGVLLFVYSFSRGEKGGRAHSPAHLPSKDGEERQPAPLVPAPSREQEGWPAHPSDFAWPLSSQWRRLLLAPQWPRCVPGVGGHLVTGGPQRPGKKESVVRHLFAVTLTAATLSEPGVGEVGVGTASARLTWPLC